MPVGPKMDRNEALRVLGLPISAQGQDIRKAYKRLALIHHPDRMVRRSKKEGSLGQQDAAGKDRSQSTSNESLDKSTDDFHRIQSAFDTLQCGIGLDPASSQREHSLFKIGNDGQSISSVSADASTVAQNM